MAAAMAPARRKSAGSSSIIFFMAVRMASGAAAYINPSSTRTRPMAVSNAVGKLSMPPIEQTGYSVLRPRVPLSLLK